MISLNRNLSPELIHENFVGEAKREFEKELLLDQRRIITRELDKHSFKSSRWGEAKELLIMESAEKCAYCESTFTMVAFGDVEHYRPKSIYWWLAYAYENYLASCEICNRRFKRNNFPRMGRKMTAPVVRRNTTDAYIDTRAGEIAPDPLVPVQVAEFRQLHKNERPLILNPYYDEPEHYFAWKAEPVLKHVSLVPANESSDAKMFCEAAIEYLGLNRIELLKARWFFYKYYWRIKNARLSSGLDANTILQIDDSIDEMKQADAPYASMIRYFDKLHFDQLSAPLLPDLEPN